MDYSEKDGSAKLDRRRGQSAKLYYYDTNFENCLDFIGKLQCYSENGIRNFFIFFDKIPEWGKLAKGSG